MNLRSRKQKLVAEINITPFTDVVLVLLIIFMITTPLIVQSSIKVDIPKAPSAKQINSSNLIDVTITNEGVVYMDGEIVTKQELKDRISLKYKDNASIPVIVNSDRLVRFKDIVGVLDILNAIGVKNINIAAAQN